MAFSKTRLIERIERCTAFLHENGLSCQQIDSMEKGKQRYIVWSDAELAIVVFIYTGAVQLTAPAGRVKELFLAWVKQEVCQYYDSSSPGELGKLDSYRYLLKQEDTAYDPNAFPPLGAMQLTLQDNPLVELAELLGYVVYLLAPVEPTSPRYGIASQQAMVAQGNQLVQMFAQLITGQPAEDVEGSLPLHLSGKHYLSSNVKHSLAYWRKHTQLNGIWMTQRTLANRAGLAMTTVTRIEKERRETEQTHVYLSTARSILEVLNEIREQQDLPLLQLWNIDWASEEPDEAYI